MARRGQARFGVSGWDYADWRGPLYPPTPPRGFRALPLLARFTQFMEVNVSYYRILPPATSARWVEETPETFTFIFKAWQGWTHEGVDPRGSEREAFRALVEPAAAAGRLDGALAQLPPGVSDPHDALDRLLPLRDALAPHRLFAEVRHRDLCTVEVYARLQEEGIAFVNVDLPAVRALPPLTTVNTTPVAYLRLHGRNAPAWAKSAARDDRYHHDYSEAELDRLAAAIEELLGRCPQVLVGANNHFGAKAAAAVARLRTRVEGTPCAVPPRLRAGDPAVARETVDLPEDPGELLTESDSLFSAEGKDR